MTLGSEIHDIVGVELLDQTGDERGVADVTADKRYVGQLYFLLDREEIPGVGEGIEDEDFHIRAMFRQKIFHKIGADEAGSAGYQIFFHFTEGSLNGD